MSQDLRSLIHAGFAFVRSIEANKSTASLTLDHLLQEQITSLKKGETRAVVDVRGSSLDRRVSRWDQVDAVEQGLNAVVRALQEAGDDPGKLAQLGIFEADQETRGDEDTSTGVEEFL